MNLRNKLVLSTFAGASILGSLAACSGTASNPASNNSSSAPVTGSSSSAGSSASTTTYKNGTYSADGSYQSPAGTGTITVKVTLSGDVVTAITTKGHASDPTAKSYQAKFDSGIAGKVIGKKITALNVTNVSGSSLTSAGFDEAIKAIETTARA